MPNQNYADRKLDLSLKQLSPSLFYIQYSMYSIRCIVFDVQYLFYIQYSMYSILFIVLYALYLMNGILCIVLYGQQYRGGTNSFRLVLWPFLTSSQSPLQCLKTKKVEQNSSHLSTYKTNRINFVRGYFVVVNPQCHSDQ